MSSGYVLIADDDDEDIEMLVAALNGAEAGLKIEVANNGKSVLAHLTGGTATAKPCVLVMDMNMPKMDGRETVVAIKNGEGFKELPILLFSTSKNRTDELFAEKWGVRYFQKPDTVQGLNDVAKIIIDMCREKNSIA